MNSRQLSPRCNLMETPETLFGVFFYKAFFIRTSFPSGMVIQ
ncbi:hypothetical protein CKO_03543 [Citrobacter koseri ATCC BAA-895]|uniref:Uncharacterized protein n=1 Tax=Citrobacter koseri (strain ATCC BAA-895 / CDC 4225-83 / SGSC4696) TaxID=290338 RepID=A8AMA9_CITK8|nr:hypothetical protein CKO_03543 [Citrobacter koseri ATCC BAA-895]